MSLILAQIQMGDLCPFKVAPSDDRVFYIDAPLEHNNRQQLARGRFFEGLQTYIENKTQGNENKIIMERDEGNKTHKRYRYHSTFALSKLVLKNGLDDLWRRENPDTSEFTHYNRSSGTRSRIDRA